MMVFSQLKACAWGAAIVTTLVLGQGCICSAAQTPRQRLSFNADWLFTKGEPNDVSAKLGYAQIKDWVMATGTEFTKDPNLAARKRPSGNLGEDVAYTQPGFDDKSWRPVTLPHDWAIEGPFKQEYPGETGKLPWWGTGWYRKHFTVPADDKGRQLFLDVDGAMAYANIWLNGRYVGGWPFGYASWRVDLTPYVRFGDENVLAIRLDNPPESSRWYPGGGIYRNVWLVKTSPVHVAQWGVYVTTEIKGGSADVTARVSVINEDTKAATFNIEQEVIYGNRDAVAGSQSKAITLTPGNKGEFPAVLTVANPKLWSLKTPHLYTLVTTIKSGASIVDRYETPFGIRSIRFDAEKGFLLNGEPIKIRGVCNHHDLGALGSAINVRALERQIDILQEMGCNAIRTSHNPPAPELLDLCDRKGMLVMDEAFDAWKRQKKRNDYHLLFSDWSEKDWRAQIRRDRNHPCVILWSTGNEINEQGSPEGHKVSVALAAMAHQEDPTRPVTAGCNNVQAGYNGFQATVDVFGYNYKPAEYKRFRERNPAIPLYGSETASCISSRGEYFFPVSDNKAEGKADFQMSSYDLYAPRWAWPPDVEWKGMDENPFVAGEFVWTGFDYLGEPTPYNADTSNLLNFTDPEEKARMEKELKEIGKIKVPSRSSYFGIIDLAGFKKDRFYIYQARWRPDLPMAHILPHWNWPDRIGQVTPVHVYTSGNEAELFLNGKSLGKKTKGQYEYRLRWDDVVFQPGELKVVAYKGGKEWATSVMKTTGPAARLLVQADRATIAADGQDLSFVTVTVADANGLLVPRSKNRIRFSIEGPGQIVATDNGDATSFESFQSTERDAYNGLCLAIVRSTPGQAGTFTVKAESADLKGAAVTIQGQAER